MVPAADPGRTVEGATMADAMAVAEAVGAGGAVAEAAGAEAADRGGSQVLSVESKPRDLRGFFRYRSASASPMMSPNGRTEVD